MTTGDALYRAILAAPADDTPRLVYADWLDEHGRAEEAEFVRIGCWFDVNGPAHPEYADRLAREEELQLWLTAHVRVPNFRFPAGLKFDPDGWWTYTRRGFPRELNFVADGRVAAGRVRALAGALEKAFAAVPTRGLFVEDVEVRRLADLLRLPPVGRLETLTLLLYHGAEPLPEAARVVAACPGLGNLRELRLLFDPGEAGALALAGSPHLGRVEGLGLEAAGLTPAAVRALAGAGWFRGLRSLTLDDLPGESLAELCRAGPFPRLHTLHLTRGYGGGQVPVAGWEAFARSAAFPALARLGLTRSDLSGGRAEALFAARRLRPAYLDLSNCAVGNAGAAALAAAPGFGAVRWLGLDANGLTPAGAAAVVGSRVPTGLKYLDLSDNRLGPSNLQALARNPALRDLRSLRLRRVWGRGGPTAAHFREFLARLDLPALRHLDLADSRIGPRAARLLTADRYRSLARLNLYECRVGDETAAGLRAALPDLVEFIV